MVVLVVVPMRHPGSDCRTRSTRTSVMPSRRRAQLMADVMSACSSVAPRVLNQLEAKLVHGQGAPTALAEPWWPSSFSGLWSTVPVRGRRRRWRTFFSGGEGFSLGCRQLAWL